MNQATIYALGFFDGVHLGHQALLEKCKDLAAHNGCAAGVVTFTSHPEALVAGVAPQLIQSVEDRRRLLQSFGMEKIVELPFDAALRTMPWEDFLELLRSQYAAAGFVCGDDFRFGYQGQGNSAVIQQWCQGAGLPCAVVPEQRLYGQRISSTGIRELLQAGQVEQANRFLGHRHTLTGRVIHGRGLGRTIGIPTANLQLPAGVILPKNGVYACTAQLEGKSFVAVTNIGSRPTVEGQDVTVEAWLLDFAGDLYGQTLTLEFCSFLRPEEKFPSVETMAEQIRKDGEQARQWLKKL